ncbi:MAG TPA: hypothetical protein VGI17_09340 [Solirubrobacterales bacterium]|jgi:hypothetical protein
MAIFSEFIGAGPLPWRGAPRYASGRPESLPTLTTGAAFGLAAVAALVVQAMIFCLHPPLGNRTRALG